MKKNTLAAILAATSYFMSSAALAQDVSLKDMNMEQLAACLTDSSHKQRLLEELNTLPEGFENRWGVEVYDVSVDKVERLIPDSTYQRTQASKKGMHKASMLDASGFASYHITYKYTYMSIDGNNNPTRLSGVIYAPEKKDIEFGMLNCHPTVTSNPEAPTGSVAPDAAVRAMADEKCLVVCPDYCGYGISAYKQHPYLIQDVTARNCIDGYLAAIDYIKSVQKTMTYTFAGNFHTLVTGYSQGGSAALACHKMLESGIYSQDDLKIINHTKTFCGDGPYSTRATIEQYLEWANSSNPDKQNLAYPCVLPLIGMAAKDSYDKDCMHTIELEDLYTPEFLATGIVDDVRSTAVTTEALNKKVAANGFTKIYEMMSDKIFKQDKTNGKWVFNTETNAYKCLMRALDKNDLTKGWKPQKPIKFLHYKDDLVVPYRNMELIQAQNWGDKVEFIEANTAYGNIGLLWSLGLPDKKEFSHVTIGTVFYIWIFSEESGR